VVIPRFCIESVALTPETECRENDKGTLTCAPLKMVYKPQCGETLEVNPKEKK